MHRHLYFPIVAIVFGLLLSAAPASHATVIDRVAAVVNNQAIALSELNSAWLGSRNLPGAPASREALLTHMVELSLQRQLAENKGIAPSQEEIDQTVLGIMMDNNISSVEALEQALAAENRSLSDLEGDIANQMAQFRLIQQEVASQVRLSDAQLHDYYREHQDRFIVDQRIHVRQIHIAVDADNDPDGIQAMTKLQSQINDRESYLEAEKGLAGSPGITVGEVGEFARGELTQALDAVLFALPEGGVSAPVTLPSGSTIFFIDRIVGGTAPAFSGVQGQVQELATQAATEQRLVGWLADLKRNAYIEIHDLGPEPK